MRAQLWTTFLLLSACAAAPLPRPQANEAERQGLDLDAAQALFERNIRAIQEKDRAAYVACYLPSELLVRGGPEGVSTGFAEFEAAVGTEWPTRLEATDMSVHWLGPGLVYGSYAYEVEFQGQPVARGRSERIFVERKGRWFIAVTTAFPAPSIE
ncbi:MAG: hypothetical protein AAGJ19_19930 [Myxococcota bacterium]